VLCLSSYSRSFSRVPMVPGAFAGNNAPVTLSHGRGGAGLLRERARRYVLGIFFRPSRPGFRISTIYALFMEARRLSCCRLCIYLTYYDHTSCQLQWEPVILWTFLASSRTSKCSPDAPVPFPCWRTWTFTIAVAMVVCTGYSHTGQPHMFLVYEISTRNLSPSSYILPLLLNNVLDPFRACQFVYKRGFGLVMFTGWERELNSRRSNLLLFLSSSMVEWAVVHRS